MLPQYRTSHGTMRVRGTALRTVVPHNAQHPVICCLSTAHRTAPYAVSVPHTARYHMLPSSSSSSPSSIGYAWFKGVGVRAKAR
eukprot:928199-Rhodomonas_salina.1